jgi:hypothetical protein
MSASDLWPGGKSKIPGSVKHLDDNVVIAVLSRHAINVTDAAAELGVSSADLRRLLYARPQLTDAAVELEERRLDKAEANILEALHSDDSRRRDAASFFVVRNSARARKRGWITSSSSTVDLNVNSNLPLRTIAYRWRTEEDDERDAAAAERMRDEGKQVKTIGWVDGKTIEHEAKSEPSGIS